MLQVPYVSKTAYVHHIKELSYKLVELKFLNNIPRDKYLRDVLTTYNSKLHLIVEFVKGQKPKSYLCQEDSSGEPLCKILKDDFIDILSQEYIDNSVFDVVTSAQNHTKWVGRALRKEDIYYIIVEITNKSFEEMKFIVNIPWRE